TVREAECPGKAAPEAVGMLSRYWLMAERVFGGRGDESAQAGATAENAAATETPVTADSHRTRGEAIRSIRTVDLMIVAIAATAVFWLGYHDGGYSVAARTTFAIAITWAMAVAVVFGVLPAMRPSRPVIASAALLGAFALLTVLSSTWAEDAEGAF